MRKPDIKGLTKLAQVIRRTPKKNFDMSEWWQETPCGTSGCIAGHAATLFPHRFKKVTNRFTSGGEDVGITRYEVEHRRTGSYGSGAFADGFHITEDDAAEITIDHMWRTPKQAAKAIMVLVGRLKKELKK